MKDIVKILHESRKVNSLSIDAKKKLIRHVTAIEKLNYS